MKRTEWLAHLSTLTSRENLTESPIEQALYRTFLKYLAVGGPFVSQGAAAATSGQLYPQVPLPTRAGAFRADFLLVSGTQITLIECDGASFHADPFDDHLRSAFIIDAGLVDQVIRFNGSMLHRSPHDAALWTTAVAPGAFWPGAETAIARAATPEGVAALPQHRKHLRAGHCDFSYEAVTEDTDRSQDDNPWPRRTPFAGTYHTGAAAQSRPGELLATLRQSGANTVDELERVYWAQVKAEGRQVTAAFWASVYRERDAASGPFTRALFDEHFPVLCERFLPQRPKASAEAYFGALSTFRYAGQFMRAFDHVFRYDTFFPTPEEFRDAASQQPGSGLP